jgi:hypothetical protein
MIGCLQMISLCSISLIWSETFTFSLRIFFLEVKQLHNRSIYGSHTSFCHSYFVYILDITDEWIKSLEFHEWEVTKYKASSSLRYLACLVLLPWLFHVSLRKALEPWVTNWRITGQSHNFLYTIQEESVLGIFDKLSC